jgi:DNA-binding beta-propeller fold protein YncE
MGGGHTIPQSAYQPSAFFSPDAGGTTSILKMLKKHVRIGSTVDPVTGDLNPYGLALAGKTLFVCNFNASSNVQGTGTTIVTLATKPGSAPKHFAADSSLKGCSSLTINRGKTVAYATGALAPAIDAYCAKGAACGGTGKLIKSFTGKSVVRPWGSVWAVASGIYGYASRALYVSDATTGSIYLAISCAGGQSMCPSPMTPIVTGFKVNHGVPGSIFGPSGLAFDPKNCVKIGKNNACGTLYVVDGANNTVVAIHNVMNLRKARSIVVGKSGKTFSGPAKSWASLIYAGKPLNGPISSALLFNGNLVVGNTSEPAGTNSLIEIAQPRCVAVPCKTGKVVAQVNVDKGAAGALFGIAASGSKASNTVVYFNDDNANDVQALMP